MIVKLGIIPIFKYFHESKEIWINNQFIEANLRTPEVIAIATIIFGVLLYLSDLKGKQAGSDLKVTLGLGFLIGLAQVFALIPGTSRSGITITAALLLGFSRTEAARFSFLLAIPAIIAANILGVFEVIQAASFLPVY